MGIVSPRDDLTKKMRKVVVGKLAGMSLREIGAYAYPNTKQPKVMANQMLKHPAVQKALDKALTDNKVTPDRVAKVVSDGLDAVQTDFEGKTSPDHVIRHKFADMSIKVLGGYAPDKVAHAHRHSLTDELLKDLDNGKI